LLPAKFEQQISYPQLGSNSVLVEEKMPIFHSKVDTIRLNATPVFNLQYNLTMEPFEIKPINSTDKAWVTSTLTERWGSPVIITRGVLHQADSLPGFIALLDGNRVGLITYRIANNECEGITLDSFVEGKGIGSALICAVKEAASKQNCKRLWIITTNDNVKALRFYQRHGFTLAALYPNAIEQSRKIKPEIPLIGIDDIPLRNEIELEIKLS